MALNILIKRALDAFVRISGGVLWIAKRRLWHRLKTSDLDGMSDAIQLR